MLSAKAVSAALRRPGRHHDGHGLYLEVGPRSASWVLRYQRDHRERWLGLGPHRVIGLAGARERARAARLSLLDGIDPIDARKNARAEAALAAAKAMTFESAVRSYFQTHKAKWRNDKSASGFIAPLETYALPVLGRLPVAGIDTTLVLKVIEPLWAEKTITAGRLRGSIEAVLDWAKARGYYTSENPARWDGHIDQILPPPRRLRKVEHLNALTYSELPAFMTLLRSRPGIAARALELTILTAARTGEVLGATWDEMDLNAKTWTVPAVRMKAGKEHRVPLSAEALRLVQALPREANNPFLFPGMKVGRGLSPIAMAAVLKRMERTDITVHGMRSAFRTWSAERTNIPREIAEQALGHAVGSAVERSYRRTDMFDKRRKLMTMWAEFCGRPSTADVVPLRPAAS